MEVPYRDRCFIDLNLNMHMATKSRAAMCLHLNRRDSNVHFDIDGMLMLPTAYKLIRSPPPVTFADPIGETSSLVCASIYTD